MLILTCPRCRRDNPLTEEDVALFYPRFFCLECGEDVPFPITPEEALRLARKIDRDPTLGDWKKRE
ncbi:MAG: hypothetical protein HYY16_10955 [Planctomycetes bacterium]|nr:hypothetical protein [Planctomycetota bacterium]